jgi:hypothetical protein
MAFKLLYSCVLVKIFYIIARNVMEHLRITEHSTLSSEIPVGECRVLDNRYLFRESYKTHNVYSVDLMQVLICYIYRYP